MYLLKVRLYDETRHSKTYGELWKSDGQHSSLLMNAHVMAPKLPNDPHERHQVILLSMREVCEEIAGNLSEAIFDAPEVSCLHAYEQSARLDGRNGEGSIWDSQLEELSAWALPEEADGAWIRKAIRALREENRRAWTSADSRCTE